MENVIVALITGGCSVLAVVLTNVASARRADARQEKAQAVTDTKIEELTREVREHNNFARRMPLVEQRMDALELKLDKLDAKIEKLEDI